MKECQGGRYLDDVQQFWWSVTARVKELYPVNEVPEFIAKGLAKFNARADQMVREGAEFLLSIPDPHDI